MVYPKQQLDLADRGNKWEEVNMAEFANYGIWIVAGLLFLFMMRGHTHSGGCCGEMDSHEHNQKPPSEEQEGEEERVEHSGHESSHH